MGLVQITGYYSKLMEKVRGGAEIEERERKREREGSVHPISMLLLCYPETDSDGYNNRGIVLLFKRIVYL